MTDTDQNPPFSRRANPQPLTDSDFPARARIGLRYFLHEGVEQSFLADWDAIARELNRLARTDPDTAAFLSTSPEDDVARLVSALHWATVLDFCEQIGRAHV